ncbi:MAG: type II 3-dehydroquinate dehydratase [Oscillospiraceae bacterium]|nr:type II 3-dehydroquinate dehydratase [Oscillospiraceae bacterium]
MKILVINGPNINMVGIREPAIYGSENYETLCARIDAAGKTYGVDIERYQSNYEGDIVTKIQQAYGVFDGIVINPAAYTHTSVAILDALKAVSIPAVEVHISDINQREPFRQISYPGMYCEKTIKGHGFAGYEEAIAYLAETYKK